MGILCKKRFLLKRDNISSHIRNRRGVGIFGCLATFSLFALIAFTLSPLYLIPDNTEATTKDPTPSTLTYTAVQSDAVLPVDITSTNGSFATSNDHISFKLATTNATGYTLNIKTSGNDTALVDSSNNDSNTNAISSISSTITRETFSNASNTTYNNKWGIHPSSYYQDNTTHNNTNAATSNNPVYFPASSEGFTMDSTSTANTTDNTYFVGLGVRADYTVPAGTYTNTTLIAEYVANPVTYAIHYYTNTTDTVTNMPTTNPQTGTVSSPTSSTGSIITTIASTPTRTGYTFLGWCMGASSGTQNTTNNSTISNITNNATTKVDSCSSTVYDAGQSFGIDTTSTNPDTYYLYAMWSVNSYTCTKQYRLQNADGSWGNYTADGTEQIKYGETCNYSKTVTNYKNAANGTNNSTATTSGIMNNTNGITLSLDLYRNTFTCKISYKYQNADGTYGSATVAVNTTKRYGEACSWSTANISNFDSTTYKAANYTNNSITANVDTTVNIDRNTFTVTKRYRLQGTDGTYPTTYTSGGTETVRYGASTTYSIAATTSHQAASKSSGTVTANTTISLDVPRKTFTITKQYRLQGTDASYPSSYTADGTATVVYGGSYTYSRAATTTHQAASTAASNVTANQTLSLDVPRKTFTITKQYRLQGTDTNYPSTYTSDGTATVVYGGSYTYSRAATTTHQAASTAASNVTANQTLSLSVPRKTFTCTKQYRLENADGTWGSYTSDGTVTAVYGGSCSYSKTVTNYRGSSSAANGAAGSASASNVTANQTLSISFYRNTFTCLIKYQLQNADGTYATAANGTNSTLRYGQTCSWSRNADTTYKAASYSVASITANVNQTVNVDRNTFTCLIKYQLQKADGTYDTATNGTNSTLRYGQTCSWSRAADTTYKAASYSTTITANVNQTVSVDRNTFTCSKRYRLQNADGTWGSYTADGSVTALYGGSCSYSKTVTDYKGSSSGSNGAQGSTSASNVTATTTLSLDFYRNTFALTVNRNTTYISSVTGAGTYRWGQSVSISATPATNSAFSGWTVSSGSTGTFAAAANASTTYTMPKGASTIYANGRFNLGDCTTSDCMQTYTKTVCEANATSSDAVLTDARDGKTYTVRYISNECWMTQNLAIAAGTTLTSTLSNVTTSYTIPLTDLTSGNSLTEGRTHAGTGGKTGTGYWYNYCAASAGTICSNSTLVSSSQDICPAGWHLPTSNQFQLLANTYGTSQYINSLFSPVGGGFYYNGSNHSIDANMGNWWSSSPSSYTMQHHLYYNGSVITLDYVGEGEERENGNYVRCVLGN